MSSTTPGSDPERPRDDEREPAATEPPVSVEPEPELEPVASDESAAAPTPDSTARLDEAVERANAAPVASDTDDVTGDVRAPVPADSVRRDTYVPSASVATGTAAGAATVDSEPEPVYVAPQPGPQTIYVQAPTRPKARGNRGFGVLVALIGTVLFALLYAGVAYLLLLGQGDAAEAATVLVQFLSRPVFWIPVVAFFIGFALLAAIINRGPWWPYAVFGLLVGVLVYFSYLGGALLTVEAWTLTGEEVGDFIAQRWLDPFALAAGIIAREIPIWLGGWIAARGRTVAERNRLALEAYDRELAAGPQPQRP